MTRLFDLRPGERRVVLPALGFAFLCLGAQAFSDIAASTLFVTSFSLGALSRFILVSSLARVGVALGFGVLSDRLEGPRFDAGFVVVTGGSMLLAAAAARSGSTSALYGACVLLALLPTLLPLVAINATMAQLHARQAKRLLPLVAAAATVGAITMSVVAKVAAPRLGTPSLLLFGALLCAVSALLPRVMASRGAAAGAPRDEGLPARAPRLGRWARLAQGARDLSRLPAVRVFTANAFLVSVATTLVDFSFKAALKARYERDDMASFLGTFNVVSEGAILLAQLFVVSRVVGRLGIRGALQARPALLLPLAPLLALSPGVGAAVSAKLAEGVVRYGLTNTAGELLLAPVPSAVRSRAKVLAKAGTVPLGALLAGGLLALFGKDGPSPLFQAVLLGGTSLVTLVLVSGAGRAYTAALFEALGRGRARLDESPAEAALLRTELRRTLAQSVADGDSARALATLGFAGDDLLSLDDLAPALAAPGTLGAAAARAAAVVAGPGQGDRLLALVPSRDDSGDDEVERLVLARARSLGATPDRARLERAIVQAEASVGASDNASDAARAAAGLWAEALMGLSGLDKDPAVKRLRKAALGEDSPRRASALRALGELGERRAEREILRALGSTDAAVFAEAARAAVLVQAQGAVPTLVARLTRGPHVRAAAHALTFAGPSAIGELIAALPTTVGGGDLRTAVATGCQVTGTVRAARVLARLGPEACERLLTVFGELGYRARNSVARSLATIPARTGHRLDGARVEGAMELTLAYAERLVLAQASSATGLLGREIHHRIGETADRLLDLASSLGDRAMIARTRAALRKDARARGHALELLENVLPSALAARTVALLEHAEATAPAAPGSAAPAFDGWLEKCRLFDRGELPSTNPMQPVLDKLLALHESSLFAGLSGEDLYPVAEIAQPTRCAAGDLVVQQGDPGDALFVVAGGTVAVVRDGKRLRELGRGGAFGEMALLDGAPRSASVEAVTDAELLRIPREEFEALLDESPALARGIIRTLLGYIRATRP